ncbi:hypothetical protein D3C75_1272620 [compost metagenome]
MPYKIELKRSKEEHVSVTYDGEQLQGIVGFKLETTEQGPVVVLTLRPDLVELDVGFIHPQRSQSL